MDNSSSLINSLSSPGLLVLTSTAEPTRGTNAPCQPARHFGVQMSMDKPNQMPFLSTAYSLMYHHPERLTAPSRAEYPPQLLSLHPQFAHSSLDCGGVGMLGYGALHPFPPFHLTEDMDCFQAGYLSAKRAKMLTSSDPPQVRYLALEKELEAQRSQISRDIGNGMEGQSSGTGKYRCSPTSRQTGNKRKKKAESPQPLYCPLCQRALQRGELADHLQYEMGTLSAHLSDSEPETPREEALLSVQSPSSGGVAHEGTESPRGSPQVSEEGPKVDRQQSFQQVKSNREARLGARAGRCRRMKGILDDQLAGCLLRVPRLGEAEDELSEGSRCGDDDYRFSRKGLSETKESQLSTPRSTSSRDGDVDMVESDGDEQLPFPPHKFSCPRSSMPLVSEEGQNASFHLEATAKRKEEEHGIAAKTMHMLKSQIQELTQRLLRADEYKCHICLDSYSVPLASIQCWHIHCEQCWLRTLGTKKLCPQCHTITSPADLRRVYL